MILGDAVEDPISAGVESTRRAVECIHRGKLQTVEPDDLSSTSSYSSVERRRVILVHDVSTVAAGGMSVFLESMSHPYCCFTGELLITNHRSREDNLVTSLDPLVD